MAACSLTGDAASGMVRERSQSLHERQVEKAQVSTGAFFCNTFLTGISCRLGETATARARITIFQSSCTRTDPPFTPGPPWPVAVSAGGSAAVADGVTEKLLAALRVK